MIILEQQILLEQQVCPSTCNSLIVTIMILLQSHLFLHYGQAQNTCSEWYLTMRLLTQEVLKNTSAL